jgi:hypothetical protein
VVALRVCVGGCAVAHQTYAPDGRKAYTLNCSGAARGWGKCTVAAGDLCGPAGYDILDRTYDGLSVTGADVNTSSGSGFRVNTHERSMLVACR